MARSILLIVDMVSPYDFPGAEKLADGAEPVIERINEARRTASAADVPVVFANDADEDFSGSRQRVFERALAGEHPELVAPLQLREHEHFLHKGQHSAFYGTALAHMLHLWKVDELVLAGQVTEQCVLYTALDAHVRHYGITLLGDCLLAEDRDLGDAAVRMMETNMGARTVASRDWRP